MFERCLYFNVNNLARTVNRLWENAYADTGLSPAHSYLLRLVCKQPGLPQKQIALELGLEKSTVARFVAVLEAKGYVKRSQTGGDAREQAITPSRKGLALHKRLEKTGEALYAKMAGLLGDQALKSLVNDLREVKNKLST